MTTGGEVDQQTYSTFEQLEADVMSVAREADRQDLSQVENKENQDSTLFGDGEKDVEDTSTALYVDHRIFNRRGDTTQGYGRTPSPSRRF